MKVNSIEDGYKHLAVSLIERAIVSADRGDELDKQWLLTEGVRYAAYVGFDEQTVREAFTKKYLA